MKKTLFLAFLAMSIIGTANAQKIKSENVSSSSSTSSNPVKKAASKAKPSNTNFAFLMGWDGLGDNLFSGMSSNANDPYATKPWFNSWQLEFSYNVFRVNKATGYIGIGYESDVYKFDNDGNSGFVFLDVNDPSGTATMKYAKAADFAARGITKTTGWESRLCTRYVTIPLGVDFTVGENFGLGLAVIPGINFTTSHTGLKYKLDGDNQASQRDALKGYVAPVKCDVRVNLKFDLANIFVQVSPISVFKDTDKEIYPLRFGFMIKL